MRIQPQYKKYSKHYLPLECVPQEKLLKLHRPKWRKVQRAFFLKIKSLKDKKVRFKNITDPFCQINRWLRKYSITKTRLYQKKAIQTLFLNNLSNKCLQKNYYNEADRKAGNPIKNSVFKLEFRIDILLCRLQIFSHCLLVKQAIFKDFLFVNGQSLAFLSYLKKGDVLCLKYFSPLRLWQKNVLFTPLFFHSFLELDMYTGTIVVVKDLEELTRKDFFLLTKSVYNFLDIQDYLLK